jgi:hypothetical protein
VDVEVIAVALSSDRRQTLSLALAGSDIGG